MLYLGEVGVCSEQMYAWVPPQQVPGSLYLTNLRLVFEAAAVYHPEHAIGQALGLGTQGPPPMLNLEVRPISNVSAIPAPSGWHTLRVEANGGAVAYHFQTPRAQEWAASILNARGGSTPPSTAPPMPTPPPSPTAAPPVAAAAPVRAPPTLTAPPATSATPSVATRGTVWCGRCGKANPAVASKCVSCGAALG